MQFRQVSRREFLYWSMVGAGALVPPGKVLESGYLYLGSPVKQVRELSDREKRFLKYSAAHYVRLKNRHLGSAY